MKALIIWIVTAILLMAACTSDSPVEIEHDMVVIRGYIYANEPLDDFQVTSTLPISSTDTLAPPINDAEVWLVKDGVRYDLASSDGDSGYYHYDGNNLNAEEEDIFEIFVNHFGRTATGQTQVPSPPQNGSISSATLYMPEFGFGMTMDTTRNQIRVNWDAEPSALYFVVLENMEDDPDPVEMFGGGFKGRPQLFTSAPFSAGTYVIRFLEITHLGQHRIKVYRVNQEYADLYTSRQQDTRDLNEPLTNIENGLGIFSAFSSIEFYFNVVPE